MDFVDRERVTRSRARVACSEPLSDLGAAVGPPGADLICVDSSEVSTCRRMRPRLAPTSAALIEGAR